MLVCPLGRRSGSARGGEGRCTGGGEPVSGDGIGQVIVPSRGDELVRAVGRELIEQGLQLGGSLFVAGRPVWGRDTASELYELYNERPDTGSDPFMTKLHGQIGTAPDAVIQLVAELLTLQ